MPSNSGRGSPASLPPVVGEGPVCRRLAFLWCSLNPLFYERARLYIRLEPFAGKFSFFFFSLDIPHFGLLSHDSSLRLSSVHSGPVLTLSNAACTSQFSPHLLVVDLSFWDTSPLEVSVMCAICRLHLFIFYSQFCSPLRFQNSPQTCL